MSGAPACVVAGSVGGLSENCVACQKSARKAACDAAAVVVPGPLLVVAVAVVVAVVVFVVEVNDAVVLEGEDGNNTDS